MCFEKQYLFQEGWRRYGVCGILLLADEYENCLDTLDGGAVSSCSSESSYSLSPTRWPLRCSIFVFTSPLDFCVSSTDSEEQKETVCHGLRNLNFKFGRLIEVRINFSGVFPRFLLTMKQ